MDPTSRVVVLGFDAMDCTIVTELAAAGRVPALASLLDESVWGTTVTPPGFVVGSIWPSITTGCRPDRHGFYCDLQLEPGTYEARRRTPLDITTPRLWDQLGAAGLSSAVLDVPLTAPTADINGLQLVEWGAHDKFLPMSGAPLDQLDALVTAFPYPSADKCDDLTRAGRLAELRDRLIAGVRAREELYRSVLASGDHNLVFGVYGETHCAGHQLWARHDPSHPKHAEVSRAVPTDALIDVYEAVDASVGRLLADVPPSVPVVAVWSHGIGPHYDGGHLLSEILRRLDEHDGGRSTFVDVRERAVRRIQRRARNRRRALPLDGSRRFFRVPNNDVYSGVRINVRGREPRGRVAPGAEYESVVATLTESLLELRDADTDDRVVQRVLRVDELYDGPRAGELPDLLVDWVRDHPIESACSARVGVIRGAAGAIRTGDHRPRGMVAFRVPGMPAGHLRRPVPVVDLAPTIAALLGVQLDDVDGVPVDLGDVNPGRRLLDEIPRAG